MTAPAPAPATPFRPRDLLTALLVVVLWGVNFVAMKWGLRSFTPFQLGAARYIFAALPLLLMIPPPRVNWRWVLCFGMLQGVGQFGFLFIGMQVGITAGLASVLLQTQVFFTALFAFAFLHEKPGRPLVWGMALATLGLVCFGVHHLGPEAPGAAAATTVAGLVLTLCAASLWAASHIVARLAQNAAPGYDPLAFVIWSSLVPIVPFIVLSAIFDPDAARWLQWEALANVPLSGWAAVAYLGWAANTVGNALWTHLLQHHPANRVAPFSLAVPVVGLTAGWLVLGETVAPWQWAGIAFIVVALACVVLGPRFQAKTASGP
ncbi:EamA family transporter [Acidovorax sp.]|uniref:EamA family transporter n=1 Tax=Acidovorax sp. TaxID=1872122 RepID=UPI0025B9A07F|nr:EamA family transporter [Acidovorax sp.]